MSTADQRGGLDVAALPAPVALNPECVNVPMRSPAQVLKALDALARDFNTVISKAGDPTKAGMIIGGGAGIAVGFGPGGLLFGPIGAAIGGTLGTMMGGIISQLIPQQFKNKINPAEGAQRAIEAGDYRQAGAYLHEVIKRIDEPGVLGILQKLVGVRIEGIKHEQKAMYLAARAMVHLAEGDEEAARAALTTALGHSEHNVVLLDLLHVAGAEVDELLRDAIDEVDDDVVKTAVLERYAQRHSRDAWVISMLAMVYRKRFSRAAAQLDKAIARQGGDIDWMLDVVIAAWASPGFVDTQFSVRMGAGRFTAWGRRDAPLARSSGWRP